MSGKNGPLVCCGMYAFTRCLQEAWSALLSNLPGHLPAPYNEPFMISFLDQPEEYHRRNFLFGQTCGYPYITRLHATHEVLCTPEFNIKGTVGGHYSSWFITRANSDRTKLEEFRDSVAVINTTDSNSGMNVLRHAVSRFAGTGTFFRHVRVSGSHLSSLKLVGKGAADLAAIDANTYYFAKTQGKIDENAFKIIGQSPYTMGLPFIIGKTREFDKGPLVQAFNRALKTLGPRTRETLCIQRFTEVSHEDYLPIHELKQEAENLGYPLLR
ncbi:MAG: PhnD/SsuA/transferrin family substrate-binding protein [Gammaproteobacteria bacterium]|nr:PhnD/SsuA/transferrin family substrate-binding protein [Gammaproteobacteria bacterium]